MKKVVAIIPARMASSRFPGKPLAKILDLPMIEHVRRRVALSSAINEVYVATCDREIMEVVAQNKGKAIMTADTHERCTDRIEEASKSLDGEIIVMVQGDEPLVDHDVFSLLVDPLLKDEQVVCTNLLSVISDKKDFSDVDVVKAALDQHGRMMYYTRAPIPHQRVKTDCPVYRQTGIAAFTKTFLWKFSDLSPTPLEIAESIDFLRILEHGHPITGIVYPQRTVGVDRPEDVSKVEKILREDAPQKKIYQRILAS